MGRLFHGGERMAYVQPTITDFKQYFERDFPYTSNIATGVTDADILKAQNQCAALLNQELFDSQGVYFIGFNLLSAHFLVTNLRASSQGLSGQYSWLQNSHSAGSVSESLQIPERIMANPEFAMLTKTNYGAQYLMMIIPLLSGQIFTVEGRTRA